MDYGRKSKPSLESKMMLRDELGKAFSRAKDRGAREGIRYLRGQIYSTSQYDVLRHSMEKIPHVAVSLRNLKVLEIRAPDSPPISEMYRLWPPEFGPRDTQYVDRILMRHASNGASCFILQHEGRLAGAFWLSRPNAWYASLSIPHLPGECVAENLFIARNYRGVGASKLLLSDGLRIAGQRGIRSVFGLVRAGQSAPVRALISVGFQIIGSFRQERRCFKCSELFVAAHDRE